ncbi:unnamed protein product [Nesidiocoris tenuis]|uniref:P-type ATPase A domain-containing protein n=1 Tax=Nesidiocoris tenuis TaxID=355587 RepID=A0A6H5FXB5_9HEMI|nr:unnamed protein product [Nesidiocoris tenuis]
MSQLHLVHQCSISKLVNFHNCNTKLNFFFKQKFDLLKCRYREIILFSNIPFEIRMIRVKKLAYIWVQEKGEFVRLAGLDNGMTKEKLLERQGLTRDEQRVRQLVYGKNNIEVPIQSISTLVVLEVLNPFYVFQVFSLSIWLSDNYYYYSVAIIIMSIFGISSSVIQTRKNQKNLHDTINQVELVTVRRADGHFEEIETTELVPGDVIAIPPSGGIACCDALLLNGTCVVNESMLTGESVPVTKTPAKQNQQQLNVKADAPHILYCGTQILQTRKRKMKNGDSEFVLALVLRTGFLTSKGSLVQSILYPPPADFKFDRDSYKFIWFLALMGFSGVIYSMYHKSESGMNWFEIYVKSLDLLTIAIPVALPASMTVGKIFALDRLKRQKISCINSRVINVSGSINCVCFDKTGTLTEDGLDMWGVVPAVGGAFEAPLHDASLLSSESTPLLYGMATSHSLTIIDNDVTGDPLDLKMFQATGWSLEEPEFIGTNHNMNHAPTAIVRTPPDNLIVKQLEIVHQFQFFSHLQRMSVIVRDIDSNEMMVYCKGSPETIVNLSQPMTVPVNTMKQLKEYTAQGYRVLAMAWKPIAAESYDEISKGPREGAEKDLRFAGLIILENRLKDHAKETILTLRNADMKVVMITGDNIQTAICVAKDCGIMNKPRTAEIDLNEKDQLVWYDMEMGCDSQGMDLKILFEGSHYKSYDIAATGKAWARIRSIGPPGFVAKLAKNGAVFARMASDQKQQVIMELQDLGFVVAMCGDGANDCGALKAANVGISLSEAEASVASPFTSQNRSIACVLNVIREGRAALVTSFGIFKFMILYSFTEFFSTLYLYSLDTNLTDFQFLYIDVFLIVNFAFLFGRSQAYKGPIAPQAPPATLLGVIPIISMLLQVIVVLTFQTISVQIIRKFPWFEPFHYTEMNDYVSYENFAIYTLSQFQYITQAVTFSQSHPYRGRIYENKIFFASILIMTSICIYLTVDPADWLIDLFEFRYPPSIEFPCIVIGLAAVQFLISVFFENFIVDYLLSKKLKIGLDSILRSKRISNPC